MIQYHDLLRRIKHEGVVRQDRTGVGTIGIFGHQMRFDLQQGFPLVTTKKVFTKAIIHELLWFLSGDTNVKYLQDNGVTIWDEWATPEQCAKYGRAAGDLGPVYGHQWRRFGSQDTPLGPTKGVDQISRVVSDLKTNPFSRRLIVTGWNPAEADQVALPPCHTLMQFYVSNDRRLSCQLYQRSADVFLGVPFNIASYALLTMMLAQVCDLQPGEFVHTFGDVHIYLNHQEQVDLQLSREPRPLPTMRINPDVKDIFSFKYDDFKLEGYNPHPAIAAPVAI